MTSEGPDQLPSEEQAPSSSFEPQPTGRSLRSIANDLWRPKGTSASRGTPSGDPKQLVEGLDRREITIGLAAATFDLLLTLLLYFAWRHNSDVTLRRDAASLLVSGLIGTVLLSLGIVFRRRALLGFAAFIAGLQMISFGQVQGVLYLAFGGWLIMRALRKQKQTRAGVVAASPTPVTTHARVSSPPKASKRYTPPRRRGSANSKRR